MSTDTASTRAAERDLLRTIAAGTATVTGRAFFRSLVHHVALALGADVAWASEMQAGPGERAVVIASWGREDIRLPEGHDYDLSQTPCEGTIERDVVSIPENVGEAYPNDTFIAEHGLSGYLAVVMRSSDDERLGYIGVMSRGRLEATEDELAVLSIFASRAAAEIERRRHEVALRAREAEVAQSRSRVVSAADEE
ncbi:MAG TPA: GAF domain-containing protein, partial [Thermoleophilaceae bacterium]